MGLECGTRKCLTVSECKDIIRRVERFRDVDIALYYPYMKYVVKLCVKMCYLSLEKLSAKVTNLCGQKKE